MDKTKFCIDCGKEIERRATRCNSCSQLGERNHRFGNKSWNRDLTKETDERVKGYGETLSKVRKGRSWENRFGQEKAKILKEQRKEKMLGKKNHFYGKNHSEETKKLIGEKRIGKKFPKLSESKKKLFAEGKLVPWNKNKECPQLSLEKNGNWQGGKSSEPYGIEFNDKFKRAIRKRDNQICMLCNIHREKLSRALDVHHIDGGKKLSIPQNCLSLCRSCHNGIVHGGKHSKEHWINFFHSLLNKNYGYEYTQEGEIKIKIGEQIND